jgi:hypothetical protein
MELLIVVTATIFFWRVFSTSSSRNATRQHKKQSHKKSNIKYRGGKEGFSARSSDKTTFAPLSETKSGIPIKFDVGYRGPYRPSNRKVSDFRYPENPNPQEFLVYLIFSAELGALKIGVGTSGRVLQLVSSTIRTENGFENVGWKVLKTGSFSTGPENFETGRDRAYEAERRVLFYWRKHLLLPAKVSDRAMGWSQLLYQGERGFHLTKGFTETVDLYSVCEESTWNIVRGSPGYLGDGSSFYHTRELHRNSNFSISSTIAPGYREYSERLARDRNQSKKLSHEDMISVDDEPALRDSFKSLNAIPKTISTRINKKMPASDGTKEGKFWARVDKQENACWMWLGSISTDLGYAQMYWEGSERPAHRVAWQLRYGEMPTGDQLWNTCGTRTCINPEHWELRKTEAVNCASPECHELVLKVANSSGRCDRCARRRRYEYRKSRPNPYTCINADCNNPSGTVAFASLCMPCRRRGKAHHQELPL